MVLKAMPRWGRRGQQTRRASTAQAWSQQSQTLASQPRAEGCRDISSCPRCIFVFPRRLRPCKAGALLRLLRAIALQQHVSPVIINTPLKENNLRKRQVWVIPGHNISSLEKKTNVTGIWVFRPQWINFLLPFPPASPFALGFLIPGL